MYKIKIINYKPYEYELLSKKLNQLGQDGWICKDLSFFSIFKKTDHPIHYHIDFFKSSSHSKKEKQIDKLNYYDTYIERKYYPIYHKNGLCVFMNEDNSSFQPKINNKYFLQELDIIKYLSRFLSAIGISLMSIILFFVYSRIQSFLSNGILLFYCGFICLFMTMIYRTFLNYKGMKQMKSSFEERHFHFLSKKHHSFRYIYGVLSCVTLVLIISGIALDFYSAKEFTINEHPILTLSSLTKEETKELTTTSQSSILVPHFYSSLEIGHHDSILYIKEYHLTSQQKASQLMQNYQNNPKQLSCSRFEKHNNILYGYVNDTLATFVIQKENQVTVVSLSFVPQDEHIQKIISFYN